MAKARPTTARGRTKSRIGATRKATPSRTSTDGDWEWTDEDDEIVDEMAAAIPPGKAVIHDPDLLQEHLRRNAELDAEYDEYIKDVIEVIKELARRVDSRSTSPGGHRGHRRPAAAKGAAARRRSTQVRRGSGKR